MSTVSVSLLVNCVASELNPCLMDFFYFSIRFIYQDVPLYELEEFSHLAPDAARTIDEHELMKNRLEYEFTERTR